MNEMLAHAATATGASASVSQANDWTVRSARPEDLPGIAGAIASLLGELGGTAPSDASLHEAAKHLLENPRAGALLVSAAGARIVGVLGASWTYAIRTVGPHGVIQELWVDPAWRSQLVGAAMLDRLAELARARGITRVEVGLPMGRYASLARTRAFYAENGFEPLGERMRLAL